MILLRYNESMIIDIVRYTIASIGMLLFVGCAAANGSVFIKWLLYRKTGSTIPLIGGIAGCVAFVVLPWPIIRFYWWIPFILDASYVLYIITLVHALIRPRNDKRDN